MLSGCRRAHQLQLKCKLQLVLNYLRIAELILSWEHAGLTISCVYLVFVSYGAFMKWWKGLLVSGMVATLKKLPRHVFCRG